jgi:Sec-independent protein translocase protein TatA
MFAVGWSEVLLIALAAVIFLKPRDLPRLMRRIGILAGRMKELMSSVSRDLAELASEDAEDGGQAAAGGQGSARRRRQEVRRARGDMDVGSGRGGQCGSHRRRRRTRLRPERSEGLPPGGSAARNRTEVRSQGRRRVAEAKDGGGDRRAAGRRLRPDRRSGDGQAAGRPRPARKPPDNVECDEGENA